MCVYRAPWRVLGLRYRAAMRTFTVDLPVDPLRSLAPLVASHRDPTIRVRRDGVLRASRTPEGPVTLEVRALDERRFRAEATGPGRDWALTHVPALLGAEDDLTGFAPQQHPTVARAHHRRPDLRLIRSGRVEDLLVPTILAQRVTGREAGTAWNRLVTAWGAPAPGGSGLRLAPEAAQLAARPYADFHRFGVERGRAARIVAACRGLQRAQRGSHHLEVAPAGRTASGERLADALRRLPGVGPWTAALIARTVGGDPDTVEVGDYHVKHHVTYALTGETRGDDERLLELLAPFAGHRGRVVRLLSSVMRPAPSFGPRRRIVPVEAL